MIEEQTKVEAEYKKCEQRLQSLIRNLISDRKSLCLMLVALKNHITNRKTATVAQKVVSIVLNVISIKKFDEEISSMKKQGIEIEELLEVLKVFSERYRESLVRNIKTIASFNLQYSSSLN